jgi:hypothetical protein
MKISDKKYIKVSEEDGSRYSHDFWDFIDIPTITDYTLIPIGSYGGSDIYDIHDNIVLFYTELPNCLQFRNNQGNELAKILSLHTKFNKILTDCEFSVNYFNEKFNFNKFCKVFLPINPKYIPTQTEKCFDVYYTGHYFNSPIKNVFSVLNEKYNFCSVGRDHGRYAGCSHVKKLSLNAQSKISIVHGLLEWPGHDIHNVKNELKGHKGFDLVDKYGIVPQIKTRTFEAAISKSIILSLYDPWNLIESYFEKDEFVYWYNVDDLQEKINDILSNYDKYIPMAEKAYNRVVNNYTNKIFFEKYLKNL